MLSAALRTLNMISTGVVNNVDIRVGRSLRKLYIRQTYTLLFTSYRLQTLFQYFVLDLSEVQSYTQVASFSLVGFLYAFQ